MTDRLAGLFPMVDKAFFNLSLDLSPLFAIAIATRKSFLTILEQCGSPGFKGDNEIVFRTTSKFQDGGLPTLLGTQFKSLD